MLEAATNLTMSVIMTISAHFSDGVEHLQRKDYVQAEKAFTQVIEAEQASHLFAAPALMLRAKSHAADGSKEEAMADIESLLAVVGSQPYWEAAAKLYKESGGKVAKLLPEDSPQKVWGQFVDTLESKGIKEAKVFVDSEFQAMLDGLGADELGAMTEWLGDSVWPEGVVKIDAFAKLSETKMRGKGGPGTVVRFVRRGNNWKISSFVPGRSPDGSVGVIDMDADLEDVSNEDRADLILTAISDYVWEVEAMPKSLLELVKNGDLELKDMTMWVEPDSGKHQPFLYMMDVVPNPDELARQYLVAEGVADMDEDVFIGGDMMIQPEEDIDLSSITLIVAPRSVEGRRLVGTGEGWSELDEKVFAKMALAGKWKISGLESVFKADDATVKRIGELVALMRDGKSSERKAARVELIGMGDDVIIELKKYESDPDPEIKESIKGVIKQLSSAM